MNKSLDDIPNNEIFKTPAIRNSVPEYLNVFSDKGVKSCKSTSSYPNQNRHLYSSMGKSNMFSTPSLMRRHSSLYSSSVIQNRLLSNKLLKRNLSSTSKSNSSKPINSSKNVKINSGKINSKPENYLLLAIVEGRGYASGEVGIASIDLKRPELEIHQFSDSIGYSRTLSLLYLKNPVEIIFPHTMCENGLKTKLFQLVSDHMKHSSITTIHRRYYNDKNGMQYVQNLCHKDFISVIYEIKEKYYALSTCAALIKYVEFIQNISLAPLSMKINFGSSTESMMMDLSTVRNLELVENSRDLTESNSFLSALNFTKTFSGYRLLRVNILQPLKDLPTILSRLDCVEEIIKNKQLFFSLQSQIARFVSLNHLLSLCIQLPKQRTVKSAENTITQVIALKHVLELLPTLEETIKNCKTGILKEYSQLLSDSRYHEILSMINIVVHDDIHFEKGILQMRTQKLFAIKDGINVILDVARRSYSEQIEVLRDEARELANEHSLPLRVAYNNTRGFFLQMTISNNGKTPKLSIPFIKVNIFRNTLSCTTEKIIRLNERLRDALSEIYLTGELVLSELIKSIRVHMGVLYRLSEIIATLDLILSYAQLSKTYNYVRPTFTNTLALKSACNPLLQRLSQYETVSNHVYSSEDSNLTVITGANMSGKSVYLRKIALIQIMGQIGCFVPAEYASLRLTDHLFTRIGVDDDIQSNSSTFTIEMREMSYIINSVTENSLVIVDELGRGTSIDEGLSLCFAICENLILTKAFIFIATHFIELTYLEKMYPNVINLYFETQRIRIPNSEDMDNYRLNFTYRCVRGQYQKPSNGMEIIKISSLPNDLITEADFLRKKLTHDGIIAFNMDLNESDGFNRKIAVIHDRINSLLNNSMLPIDDVKLSLKKIKENLTIS